MKRGSAVYAVKTATTLALLVVILEALAYTLGFPHVRDIFEALVSQARQGLLMQDIAVSLSRWAIGFSVGTTIGIALGVFTGRIQRAAFMFEGLFVFFRGIPFIALLPLTLFVFGISESGKFFLIAWVSAGVSWVIAHQAAKNIRNRVLWRMQVLNISTTRKIFQIILPSIRYQLFTAIRTSLSLALIVVAVVEMGGVYERSTGRWWSEGLGYRIFRSYDVGDLATMMASVLVLALLGLMLDQLFRLIWDRVASVRERYLAQRVLRRTRSLNLGKTHAYAGAKEALHVKALTAGFYGHPIVRGVDIEIAGGETMAIVGPSGTGKSTLLRAIGNFKNRGFFVHGERRLGDLDIGDARIGVVFQEASVLGHMTVWDNAMFGIAAPTEADIERVGEMLKRFGLLPHAHRLAEYLSGGQRQRLAIATALAYKPALLLLDEPFGALDAITRRKMQEFYFENVKGNITALFITHDIEEAVLIGDHVRIGTRPNAPSFPTGSDERPEVREFTPAFVEQKKAVSDALHREYDRESGVC